MIGRKLESLVRNVVIFGIDNSSSSHTDNLRNGFLILGEGDTFGINGSLGAPEKKFCINFSKVKTKFCLSLHDNGDNSHLFVNVSLKLVIKMLTFQIIFV